MTAEVSDSSLPAIGANGAGRREGDALVDISGLEMHFPVKRRGPTARRATVRAVDGVDFTLRRGETLGLVGESGSGKSTIGRALLQFHRPTRGSVRFDGVELTTLRKRRLRTMRRRMQMIFQDPFASLDPRMKVGQIIGEALDIHRLDQGRRARRHRIGDLLSMVGLDPGFAERYPHEFSGGQRQRIGIARALAVRPELIVADEPISALDVSIQAQIINLLEELQDELGLTYLFIAHDLAVVRHICDRVAVMYLGKIVEIAEAEDIYSAPRHPYTRALLSAVPVPDPDVEATRQRIILTGEMPSPVDPPQGCRFHPRCWLREQLGRPEVCTQVSPDLTEQTPGRLSACHFAEQVGGAETKLSPPDSQSASTVEPPLSPAPSRAAQDT